MYCHTKTYKVHENFEDNVKYQQVSTKSKDKLNLNGYFFDNSSDKVAIVVHGLGISAMDMEQHIKLFYQMGYSVLAIDNRAHGESEGKYLTFGYKESEDIECWVNYLVQKNSKYKIVILGLSMGATSSCLYAGKCCCKNVKAVISDCGYSNGYEIFKSVSEKMILPAFGFFVPIMNSFLRQKIGCKLSSIDVVKSVQKTKVPILFIHGKKDNFVPPYMSKILFNNTPKDMTSIHLFEKSTHGTCLPDHPKEYKEVIFNFINKT